MAGCEDRTQYFELRTVTKSHIVSPDRSAAKGRMHDTIPVPSDSRSDAQIYLQYFAYHFILAVYLKYFVYASTRMKTFPLQKTCGSKRPRPRKIRPGLQAHRLTGSSEGLCAPFAVPPVLEVGVQDAVGEVHHASSFRTVHQPEDVAELVNNFFERPEL